MQPTQSTMIMPLCLKFLLSASLVLLFNEVHGAPTSNQAGMLQRAGVTPIQKVIQMLTDMLEKGKQEKHEEETRFTSFSEWCRITESDKTKTIQASQDAIRQLTADIAEAEADAERLGKEIAVHDSQIDGWEAEHEQASSVRKEENVEYAEAHKDYSESIDALERAIRVLKDKSADAPQSLVEVNRIISQPLHLAKLRNTLGSFMEEQAPEANAYEFQSTSVVEMLEKLKIKFLDEKLTLEKQEMNRKHAFEALSQKLHDDINRGKDQRARKSKLKAEKLNDAAENKGELAETKTALEADQKYLSELQVSCREKSDDYAKRQHLRQQEIEAIQKAIEIISSPKVAGAGEKHLPAAFLRMADAAGSFAQLRTNRDADKWPVQQKAMSFLLRRADESRSQLLETVASHLADDPFAKVKKMIKDLLVRLIEEAEDEADHKGWCDEELAHNKQTRDEKSTEVSNLKSKIEELGALEAKLKEEISDLHDAISAINKAVEEATAQRQEEKTKNMLTLQETKDAQHAVSQAIVVLKEFYAKAATATAFAQQSPDEDSPYVFDKPYTGMQGSKGGVIGMLEVIQSDFARVEAETTTSEDAAVREYKQFMDDSAVDKASTDKEARHKGFKLTRTTRALNQAKKDLEGTQEELDAALAYYDKLKPSCIDTGLSYADRVAHRKEEIQSLQEALRILNGEELGF